MISPSNENAFSYGTSPSVYKFILSLRVSIGQDRREKSTHIIREVGYARPYEPSRAALRLAVSTKRTTHRPKPAEIALS